MQDKSKAAVVRIQKKLHGAQDLADAGMMEL